jgi:hypothetical protein
MMMLTTVFLMERHGPRLDLEALAKVLSTTPANLRRRISERTLDIPTYVEGGKRWAAVEDVAAYFERLRDAARAAHGEAA